MNLDIKINYAHNGGEFPFEWVVESECDRKSGFDATEEDAKNSAKYAAIEIMDAEL